MSEESSGYWRGLFTGVVIGAATALILAPKRGEEIRHDLSEGASKVKEKATDISGTVAGTVAVTARDLKDRGQELVSNARARVGGVAEDAGDVAEDAQDDAQDAADVSSAFVEGSHLNGKAPDVVESV